MHVPSVKGKTVHQKAPAIPYEQPEPVPEEWKTQVLTGDITEIEGEWFVITESVPLGLRMATAIPNKSKNTLQAVLKKHINSYNNYGFNVPELRFDSEKGVFALVDGIEVLGTIISPASSGEHVPVIERAQRTIKERVRSVMASLPFKVSRFLLPYLVLYVVSRLNLLPDSAYGDKLSPKERFTGRKPSFNTDSGCKFGQYGQSTEYRQRTNTMQPRTMDIITLLPVGNVAGDVLCLHLDTWKTVRRRQIKLLPMTDSVISLLNNRATMELTRDGPIMTEVREVLRGIAENPENIPEDLERLGQRPSVEPHVASTTQGLDGEDVPQEFGDPPDDTIPFSSPIATPTRSIASTPISH